MIKQTKPEHLKSSVKSSRTKIQSKSKPAQKPKVVEKIKPKKPKTKVTSATVKSPAKKKSGPRNPISSQNTIKGKNNTLQKAKSPVNIAPKKSDITKVVANKKINAIKTTKTDKNKQKVKSNTTPKTAQLSITVPKIKSKSDIKLITPHSKIKNPFPVKKDPKAVVLHDLYTDYYVNAILNSDDKIPSIFELNNIKNFLQTLIDNDSRIKENIPIDSSTFKTYLQNFLNTFKIQFTNDFYVKLRQHVNNPISDDFRDKNEQTIETLLHSLF